MNGLLVSVVVGMLVAGAASAETGREIAERSQAAHFSYQTLQVEGAMTLARRGEIRSQRVIAATLVERAPSAAHDQALITIAAPRSLKDTRLLSWSSGEGDDQQWLMTPRTRRVRRIGDRGRNAAFVGSDFSYEDILKWQIDDYDYSRVRTGACGALTCTIVDATPRKGHSNYTWLRVFYDDVYRVRQIHYFDEIRDESKSHDTDVVPWKTLTQSGYDRYGHVWQPSRSVMTNHRSETSTEVVWSGYRVDDDVDERTMTPQSLER